MFSHTFPCLMCWKHNIWIQFQKRKQGKSSADYKSPEQQMQFDHLWT